MPKQENEAIRNYVTPDQSGHIFWSVERTEVIASLGFALIRKDLCRIPASNVRVDYLALEMSAWVNVVALNDGLDLIMVDQYRHGSGEVTREIPAGGQRNEETAVQAAVRELSEETGFIASEVHHLGTWKCNPALQNNTLSTFLALGCQETGVKADEEAEQVSLVMVPKRIWTKDEFSSNLDHYFSSNAIRLAKLELKSRGLLEEE